MMRINLIGNRLLRFLKDEWLWVFVVCGFLMIPIILDYFYGFDYLNAHVNIYLN